MKAAKEEQRDPVIASAAASTAKAQTWYAIDVTIDETAREAIEYALMEEGATGTETLAVNPLDPAVSSAAIVIVVTAYFAEPLDQDRRERIHQALLDALRIYALPASAMHKVNVREVAGRDWLAEWKKDWRPVAVGQRFVVAPPWSEVANRPQQIVIRIEPGMAFGTGTHETTRLCLTLIEKHFRGGSLLDVGTGTGILAIAAAKLFPEARIEACDTDAEAVQIAVENARLNEVAERIAFRVGSVEETTLSADCVCANLTLDVIADLLPLLSGASCKRLILSGILTTQIGMAQSRLSELGLSALEITIDGEWAAITL